MNQPTQRRPSFRHAFLAATGVGLSLALAACGGGDGDPTSSPAAANQQCAQTNSCPDSGPAQNQPVAALCPASLDYGTVYTGGSGAGEFVKMQFDTTAGTYRIQIIESAIPKKPGDVQPTRAGVTLEGTFTHPDKPLPTPAQNACALQLKTVTASDGASQAIIDPANPPIVFVGNGVAGGGIPGATIAFDGIFGIGVIPPKTFPIYPVLAFAQTESDFSKVAGSYNMIGYHIVPSGASILDGDKFIAATKTSTETINADGTCTPAAGTDCFSTGQPWKPRAQHDGAFESTNTDKTKHYPYFWKESVTTDQSSQAKGVLVIGKLEGKLVPLVIRVGYAIADLTTFEIVIDDESGLALLAPNVKTTTAVLNGSYIGSGSDLKYVSSIVQNNVVALIDPQDASLHPLGAYQMDLTQNAPGFVNTVDNSGQAGQMITSGPVFAHLYGDPVNPTFRVSVVASR
ncbi:DUF2957 domain-containing protein [Cupriavidus pampae]|uniref:DUF2957 domain-containing protein n=1 Tax=Cupriavidus pampae TaxID=659251 RepID=A0ABM8X5W1_9BURK|nr:DUF2957 domain-containing protein [Cupriavidus pampae]CAG9175335.1 hypothetical protein LMG32289_03291 [Cupriavidus pampae]